MQQLLDIVAVYRAVPFFVFFVNFVVTPFRRCSFVSFVVPLVSFPAILRISSLSYWQG